MAEGHSNQPGEPHAVGPAHTGKVWGMTWQTMPCSVLPQQCAQRLAAHLPRLIILVLAHKYVLPQPRGGVGAKLARGQHVLHHEEGKVQQHEQMEQMR